AFGSSYGAFAIRNLRISTPREYRCAPGKFSFFALDQSVSKAFWRLAIFAELLKNASGHTE
ncbi:hypothetical protein, partial [Pseudomonas corrugata]|uniref:hypothetical protein n=1 Tax=Pseudomonas corrugata TaxID=47879 RepID=UPI0019D6CEC8